ncbi:hypothetical protein [Zobellia sp. B3R18]|uniref:hypothetical protein n=1 Tax=Zobellia sp. B3R18 TaxID=2841568 RepID=UPI001C07AD52|nr:hypothetical protein [Zobellia sp. B3R18]MBU2972778.1 hypothetical protein [Zobellia sp. B3R18]
MKPLVYTLVSFWFLCCSTDKEKVLAAESDAAGILFDTAGVIEIEVSGEENAYTFNTTVISPDTGCDQYADWWEVIDLKGNLIYRRILTHSHVDEQPFSRSGASIPLAEDTQVYVRVHMNSLGYASEVQKGSVENGFMKAELDSEFAKELEKVEPLPTGCAF